MQTFILKGKTTHGKNRVREQGERVQMCPVPSCGGDVLVEHLDVKDRDGKAFLRWINIDGNDKHFHTKECSDG